MYFFSFCYNLRLIDCVTPDLLQVSINEDHFKLFEDKERCFGTLKGMYSVFFVFPRPFPYVMQKGSPFQHILV